ncbi:hypothetical protein GCM10007874_15700 [Labrys miyagiensis]|uniref:Uncharacterized protein n=1 Tax=Labrys miyagiensis TaxID=346912 RepID=A0ABQ6CE58_9HYPH|nr:hypothetical protein [Labrys miyagiensis]GLS18553.1 hypothetical protein GCM10007874_15700 [Labrys miyagiensis]
MKDIGFITSGDGAHLKCYQDFEPYLDEQIHPPTIDRADLTCFEALVILDFSYQQLLRKHTGQTSDYLAQGGFLIVFEPNRMDEWLKAVAVPWFSCETEDWKWWMRPGGRMEFKNFHRQEGILGQYARGYSDPREGAEWLCMIGGPTPDGTIDEDPIDWVWRMPSGGKLFMHNGDNIDHFCSDPRHQPNLFHDILSALTFSHERSEGRWSGDPISTEGSR